MEVEIFGVGLTMSLTWFLVLLLTVAYLGYDTWAHTYWWRKGVVYEPPLPVIANMPAFSKGIPAAHNILRKKHGKTYGVYSFQMPVLVIGDADILRHVLVKDFTNFHDRVNFPFNNEELKGGLAVLEGQRWREVRNLVSPTFSAAKMKQMSTLVNESADQLIKNIGIKQEENGAIECRELFGAFVMDTIGSCAFGLNIDSQSNPNDPFVNHAKRAFTVDINSICFLLGALSPTLGRILAYFGLGLLMSPDVAAFFRDVTNKTVALRKASSSAETSKKVDFLQLMIDAQESQEKLKSNEPESADKNDLHDDLDREHDVQFHYRNLGKKTELTNNELIAQALTFFSAGYETTNTLLGYIFYLLSLNPDIQETLISEVDEMTPSRDSVGYSSVAAMPYLDQVVCETLRLYPPATVLNRVCMETVTCDGLTIEKGVQIFVPIYTIHHDADYWPDPEKFDPERFSKANREKRHPFAWLPFGAGPHNCIGMRFALMETKMAVVRVLQKYRFQTCAQTEIPPKMKNSGFLTPINGITLKAVPRSDVVC